MAPIHDAFEGSRVPELLVAGLAFVGVALVAVMGPFVGLEFAFVVYAVLWILTLVFLADPNSFAAAPGEWFGESADEDAAEDDEDPLRVLRRRYARGDIDETEFERRLDRLLESEMADGTTRRSEREVERER